MFLPPLVVANCQNPAFSSLETFFAQHTTRYNIAFLRTLMGDHSFEVVLAPGHANAPGTEILHWRAPASR